MRWILLVLGACATASSARAPAPITGHVAPAAPVAPVVPPTAWSGRVAVAGGGHGSWSDIVIAGTDDPARQLCERVVAREVAAPRGIVQMRVARACGLEPLPAPTSPDAYHLVELEAVDQDSFVLEDAMRGKPPRDEPAPIKGQVRHVLPAADRAACEAMRTRFDAEDQREWLEGQEVVTKFLDDQLKIAIADETLSCEEAAGAAHACDKLRGEPRAECLTSHASRQMVCDEARRRHAELDERRAATRTAPASRRSCQPR